MCNAAGSECVEVDPASWVRLPDVPYFKGLSLVLANYPCLLTDAICHYYHIQTFLKLNVIDLDKLLESCYLRGKFEIIDIRFLWLNHQIDL